MDLLILGASARSAAFSAIRIGLKPRTIDLFGDADLTAVCPADRVEPGAYPEALGDLAESLEPTPWLYTGAIENRPDLVDRIARRHPLLGNPGSTLRAVRDPIALSAAVRQAGLAVPGASLTSDGIPADGSWLIKPIASGAGRGIRPWLGQAPARSSPVYFQERVEGLPLSALYVGTASDAECLGITRQFVGRPGNRFAYRGSLGPWPVEASVRNQVENLGRTIARAFGLVGLFGIDLILQGDTPWPIEVNPRYTASVEVLEWANGRSLLREHLRACASATHAGGLLCLPSLSGRGAPESAGSDHSQAQGYVAKSILHASQPFPWPDRDLALSPDPQEFPGVADIPQPGTLFRPGEPVLTVFARGVTPIVCRHSLAAGLRSWRRRIESLSSNQGVDQEQDDRGDQQDSQDRPDQSERLPPDFGPGFVAGGGVDQADDQDQGEDRPVIDHARAPTSITTVLPSSSNRVMGAASSRIAGPSKAS